MYSIIQENRWKCSFSGAAHTSGSNVKFPAMECFFNITPLYYKCKYRSNISVIIVLAIHVHLRMFIGDKCSPANVFQEVNIYIYIYNLREKLSFGRRGFWCRGKGESFHHTPYIGQHIDGFWLCWVAIWRHCVTGLLQSVLCKCLTMRRWTWISVRTYLEWWRGVCVCVCVWLMAAICNVVLLFFVTPYFVNQ